MSKLIRNKNLAFGLIEVLIVLAIVATTMLAATQITLNGMRAIKLDEIVDFANGIMVQGLEIAKSPTTVEVVVSTVPANYNGSYRLQTNADGSSVLRLIDSSQTPITLAQCTSASNYFIRIENATGVQNPQVCLQMIVTQRQSLGLNYYEVRSRLVYNVGGQTVERDIYSYRRGSFTYRVQ